MRFSGGLVLSLFIFLSAAFTPAQAYSQDQWPTNGWRFLNKENPALYNKLHGTPACQKFVKFMTADRSSEGLKTDQLVVIKGGRVVYEANDKLYGSNAPHFLWSISKTVTATIIGAAIQKGLIDTSDRLASFVARSKRGPNDAQYDRIRLSDLLEMSSGFEWHESNDGALPKNTLLDMLYATGRKNVLNYAANAPLTRLGPGVKFEYSSANSSLLLGVLKKRMGAKYDDAPWTLLFDQLGMKSARFEQDPSGNFVGGSYFLASARDLAKIGFLYLKKGMWDGKRILPENWVDYVTEVSPAMLNKETTLDYIKSEGVFGRSLWVNKNIRGLGLPFPRSPKDLFFAAGHNGQALFMIPSQDMVIARTGWDEEYWSKIDKMISYAVDCYGRGL